MSAIPIEVPTDPTESGKSQARLVRVWDLPVRVFHWSLVLAIAAAYVTAEFGDGAWMQWHGRIGWFVLALLLFRLVWGFIGTRHARFSSFVPTPARVIDYLQGRWHGAGHNPLGALSVIALLALVAAQAVTGLFANDDIAFAGPLANRVGQSVSGQLTGWHERIFYVLLGFILLHILAIVFYLLVRRTNLVAAMLTGNKPATHAEPVPADKHLVWRFAAAAFIAVAVSWLIFRDPSPSATESLPPPAATADW